MNSCEAVHDGLPRKPVRVSVTLAYASYIELVRISSLQRRSISNLAAFLLEKALQSASTET